MLAGGGKTQPSHVSLRFPNREETARFTGTVTFRDGGIRVLASPESVRPSHEVKNKGPLRCFPEIREAERTGISGVSRGEFRILNSASNAVFGEIVTSENRANRRPEPNSYTRATA